MAGSAICRKLEAEGFKYIITKTREELDLTVKSQVMSFYEKNVMSKK